jgi:acyl carrier protein
MVTTLERVKEVLKPIANESVTEATTLRSLYLDALDLVTLVGDLEDEFRVQIEDAEAEAFKTVGQIVKCIDGKGKK